MTVLASDQVNDVVHLGNGTTVDWPLGFDFGRAADLVVFVRDTGTGAEVELVLGRDYTVSGGVVTDPLGVTSWGVGTVTVEPPLDVMEELYVFRLASLEQGARYPAGPVDEKMHGALFDLATTRDLDVARDVLGTIRQPQTDVNASLGRAPSVEFPDAVARAGLYAGFDATGAAAALAKPLDLVTSSHMIPFMVATDGVDAMTSIKSHGQVNHALNPSFLVDQRQGDYAAMADESYGPDGWYFLGQQAGVYDGQTISGTGDDQGSGSSWRITANATGNTRQWLMVQILDPAVSDILTSVTGGGVATLSVRHRRVGNSFPNIAIRLLQGLFTPNSSAQGLVSTWGWSPSPVYLSGWFDATDSFTAAVGTSWTTSSVTATGLVPFAGNLAIVIGFHDPLAEGPNVVSGHHLEIKDVSLVPGTSAAWAVEEGFEKQRFRCLPRYQKTFDYGARPTLPAVPNCLRTVANEALNRQNYLFNYLHETEMLKVPTATIYHPTAALNQIRNETDGTAENGAMVSSPTRTVIRAAASDNGDRGDEMGVHLTLEANPHA